MQESIPPAISTLAAATVGPGVVLALLAAGALGCAVLAWRLRKAPNPGTYCAGCGYSLDGLAQAACPECQGSARRIEPSLATTTLRLAKLWWWWTAAVVLASVPVVALVVASYGRDVYTQSHTEAWPLRSPAPYDAVSIDWLTRPQAHGADRVTVRFAIKGVIAESDVEGPQSEIPDQVRAIARRAGVDVEGAAAELDDLSVAVSAALGGKSVVVISAAHQQVAMSSASTAASKPWVITSAIGLAVIAWAAGLWMLMGKPRWRRAQPCRSPVGGGGGASA